MYNLKPEYNFIQIFSVPESFYFFIVVFEIDVSTLPQVAWNSWSEVIVHP
jgi:hypothetical protein